MKLNSNAPALAVIAVTGLVIVNTAQAHFIWLAPQSDGDQTMIQVYFGEDASPDDPALLERLAGLKVVQLSPGAEPSTIELVRAGETLSGPVTGDAPGQSLFLTTHSYGVLERGNETFLLNYSAKTGPPVGASVWTEINCTSLLPLDVVPTVKGDQIQLQVRFRGELTQGVEVKASGPGMDDFTGVTDAQGRASFTLADSGMYSIRAKQIEPVAGEADGKHYSEIRHYSTVAMQAEAQPASTAGVTLPELPEMVTSFGAAVSGGSLYVYGGHTGDAHSYSTAEQANQLRRVSLAGGEWETLADGPHLQGLALVAHGGKLYRIGGFTAKNAEGEAHDLWSQDSVAAFDPDTGEWSDLPPLPEPRSSHDAAVVGDTIYVVGGWALAGEAESSWHETAWAMDLSQPELSWKPLPTAPFKRRALALAAHQGKLYAIGGMQQDGGPTTSTAIFDPESQTWSDGPALVVEQADQPDGDTARSSGAITGFGASAFATGGRLYVSTIKGDLQRLTKDGTAWEIVAQTPTARFFHRMLPIDDHHLLMVGGANMQIGKYAQIDLLTVE